MTSLKTMWRTTPHQGFTTNNLGLLTIRRATRRRMSSWLSIAVIISILISPFSNVPLSSIRNGATTANAASYNQAPFAPNTYNPPPPEQRTVQPLVDPHLPTLVVKMSVAPRAVSVGDVFTITLTISNEANDPANNLVVTMPLPSGTVAHPLPMPNGWSWRQTRLDGRSSMTATATLRVLQPLGGGAIVARAEATADGLTTPIVEEGGAIVVPLALPEAVVLFTPGNATTLRGPEGRSEIYIPGNAASRVLTMRHSLRPGPNNPTPPDIAGRKRGLPTFYLNATDDQGQQFHQFSAPLTITLNYTPEQVRVLGIAEEDLTLFWFDEDREGGAGWAALDTHVDSQTRTVTAQVDHFTPFQLSDGSSPSEAYIPSLQGWQVGLYNGNASYSYPIDVPAGPGGIKPSVQLTYSSTSTDGNGGQRAKQQAGWAGKGWSLETPHIALNRIGGEGGGSRYYSLVLGGQSYELVRGAALVTGATLGDPTDWDWRATDESFIKVRVITQTVSYGTSALLGRGGYSGTSTLPRYQWKVWTKDGTRYDFYEDAWQGFNDCGGSGTAFMETYKWYLGRIVDTNRNTVVYNYARANSWGIADCFNVRGTIDSAVWPTSIVWGANAGTQVPNRYILEFASSARSMDTQGDGADNQVGPAPHETRRLDALRVYSNQSSPYTAYTWDLVREYRLGYETNSANYLLSDHSKPTTQYFTCPGGADYCADTDYPKMTLVSIQRVGKDNSTVLPATTFTYNHTRGTGYYPNAAWNRMLTANNGQGGTMTLAYENIGTVLNGLGEVNASSFRNYRRVTTKTMTDGRGNSYPWTYTYSNPALNTMGSLFRDAPLELGGIGPNQYPNSAKVYYATMVDTNETNRNANLRKLVQRKHTEFRGHPYVVEHAPNGNETEHFFYQGDVGCYPQDGSNNPLTGSAILTNTCFQDMRKREFLKGKEYKTISHQGAVSGPKLSEVEHSFTVNFLSDGVDSYADDRLRGLWRAFSYENQTVEKAWDSGSTALTKTTNYSYETTYGNLTEVEESDQSGVLRSTEYGYGSFIAEGWSYLVDRKLYERVKDSQDRWLARTVYGWDGSLGEGNPGSTGRLTLVRKYHNLPLYPPQSSFPSTGYSNDTTYGYDDYGNQTTVTTYPQQGEATSGGTVFGQPGGGSTGRITTTTYDSLFHAFPVQADPPTVNGVLLRETGTWDYRMGTLTSVTGPNGAGTMVEAQYDVFGRMSKLRKPGDTWDMPTIEALYHDNASPFKYEVRKREKVDQSNYWYLLPVLQFYDGLGRKIQTKSESVDGGTQMIVADTKYDGLGQATHQSQPRYVAYTGGSDPNFWAYQAMGTDSVMRWTTSQYDGLGRPTSVQPPDTSILPTTMNYSINTTTNLRSVLTKDANSHATRRESDMFGRLKRVLEYSGTQEPYSLYSTTTYGYNPLDLLESVIDTNNKETTIQYDSLGRKQEMTDITMGRWRYGYDINGNLTTQTDALTQTITFGYDALSRLTGKTYPDNTATHYIYDEAWSANGKGQRTSMERVNSSGVNQVSAGWHYDARGRAVMQAHYLAGLGGYPVLGWSYDSADRVTSITYPQSNEAVSYTYDAAWRQTSACSNQYSPCYASNATYTALDQPVGLSFGNNLSQTNSYTSPMQRLNQIQVGTSGGVMNRTYAYDPVGNVSAIAKFDGGYELQEFGYDHRDRLTSWSIPSVVNESYTFDAVGNILTKGGTTYDYSFNGQQYAHPSGSGGPYAVRNTGYAYDAKGNMTNMPGSATLTWNYDNQPTQIIKGGVTEQYSYDADGERVKRTSGGVTTYYVGGVYEEDSNGTVRYMYTLNGQVVAQREIAPDAPTATPTGTPPPTNTSTSTPTNTSSPTNTPTLTPTSTVTPTSPPSGCTAISWTNKVEVQDYGRSIQKNVDSEPAWDNSGASSTNTISSSPGTGYVMVVAERTSGYRMFGLSNGDSSQAWNDIDFAIEMKGDGTLEVYEYGVAKLSGMSPVPVTFTGGDVLKVGVEYDTILKKNVVKWYRNTTLLYTSSSPTITYPLLVDTSIFSPGSWIHDAYLCSAGSGSGPGAGGNEGGKRSGTAPSPTPTTAKAKGASTPTSSKGSKPIAPGSINVVNTLVYLHSDHLGSVSLATNSSGTALSRQDFDPWGKVRDPNTQVTQTKVNFTGQKLDGTGLLFYNARYYDPVLARFTSADSIVPGAGSALTVDFHEIGLAGKDGGSGPETPQALNRYSYVQNRPVALTDPSGHCDPDNCPQGSHYNPGPYKAMVHSTYTTLRNAVTSKDFALMQRDSAVRNAKWVFSTEKVGKNGAWDAGKGIREMYNMTTDNIFFDAGGKKDVAYSLFGNILFGYLGAGVGYTAENLVAQGGIFDSAFDNKFVNLQDLDAIKFGAALWEKYKNKGGISEDKLAREIDDYIRTHNVWTKASINVTNLIKCARLDSGACNSTTLP